MSRKPDGEGTDMTERPGRGRRLRGARAAVALLALLLLLPARSARPEDPVRPLSYYSNIALSGNPTLDDMWERIRVAREIGADQMTRYPEVRAPIATAGMMDSDLLGKLVADMQHQMRSEVKMAYRELFAVRKQAEAAGNAWEALREVAEISRKLYLVGKGGQPDVLRAEVAVAKAREEVLELENQETRVATRLNVLSGLKPGDPVPPVEPVTEFPFPYTAEELIRTYREERILPKVMLQTIRKGRSMGAAQEQREIRYMDIEAQALIASAHSSIRTRGALISLYRATVIPQAEQVFQALLEGYRVGRTGFPLLMDAAREVYTARKTYYSMVGEIHVARAKLEGVVGKAFP